MEKNIFLCQKCESTIFSFVKEDKAFQINDFIKIKEDNNLCEFCFNSLDENKYIDLILNLEKSIKEYEFLNINIQTRFSCLFPIFHSLLINNLFNADNKNKEIISQTIKSSLLRKLFKEKFFPFFSNKLNL